MPSDTNGLDLYDLRSREVQAIGAAISTRNWHALEQTYNTLRDKLDRAGYGIGKSRPTPTASEATAIGAGEWSMVNRLRDEEADSVTVLCDNPDGPPNNAVECNGFWTGFVDRRFDGETIMEALRAAVVAKDEAARIGYPPLPDTAAASPKVASDTAPGVREADLPAVSEHDAYRLRKIAEADCGCRMPAPFDEVADHLAAIAFQEGVKRYAALAASPTASDTDTAIPAGECTCGSPYFDLGAHVSTCPSLAASPKPDTDTPVDPGVEGVERAVALVRRIAAKESWQSHYGKTWEEEATEIVAALAAKPIAGMDAGEVEDA